MLYWDSPSQKLLEEVASVEFRSCFPPVLSCCLCGKTEGTTSDDSEPCMAILGVPERNYLDRLVGL